MRKLLLVVSGLFFAGMSSQAFATNKYLILCMQDDGKNVTAEMHLEIVRRPRVRPPIAYRTPEDQTVYLVTSGVYAMSSNSFGEYSSAGMENDGSQEVLRITHRRGLNNLPSHMETDVEAVLDIPGEIGTRILKLLIDRRPIDELKFGAVVRVDPYSPGYPFPGYEDRVVNCKMSSTN